MEFPNMDKVFIIAEAGVNHNGNPKTAERMIDAAVEAGASAIKFQTFKTEKLVTGSAPKAAYQAHSDGSGESQYKMLKRLELSKTEHRHLMAYSRQKDIIFISTPFDLDSVNFLDILGMDIFKIPSGEITNLPYLKRIGSLKKRVIMSTGMADLGEIRKALGILLKCGTKREDITILHCNTEYPTPYGDVNLRAMLTIKNVFKVNVGYSDHTSGIEIPIAAVALGASVIEKHFTLDRRMKGPDHCASLEPGELAMMVRAIRNIELSLGSGIKAPSASEYKNRRTVRKGIFAAKHIKKGEDFTEANIAAKRPAYGLSAMEWDRVIGKKAKKGFKKDEAIFL